MQSPNKYPSLLLLLMFLNAFSYVRSTCKKSDFTSPFPAGCLRETTARLPNGTVVNFEAQNSAMGMTDVYVNFTDPYRALTSAGWLQMMSFQCQSSAFISDSEYFNHCTQYEKYESCHGNAGCFRLEKIGTERFDRITYGTFAVDPNCHVIPSSSTLLQHLVGATKSSLGASTSVQFIVAITKKSSLLKESRQWRSKHPFTGDLVPVNLAAHHQERFCLRIKADGSIENIKCDQGSTDVVMCMNTTTHENVQKGFSASELYLGARQRCISQGLVLAYPTGNNTLAKLSQFALDKGEDMWVNIMVDMVPLWTNHDMSSISCEIPLEIIIPLMYSAEILKSEKTYEVCVRGTVGNSGTTFEGFECTEDLPYYRYCEIPQLDNLSPLNTFMTNIHNSGHLISLMPKQDLALAYNAVNNLRTKVLEMYQPIRSDKKQAYIKLPHRGQEAEEKSDHLKLPTIPESTERKPCVNPYNKCVVFFQPINNVQPADKLPVPVIQSAVSLRKRKAQQPMTGADVVNITDSADEGESSQSGSPERLDLGSKRRSVQIDPVRKEVLVQLFYDYPNATITQIRELLNARFPKQPPTSYFVVQSILRKLR